jgi:hypothetical protein
MGGYIQLQELVSGEALVSTSLANNFLPVAHGNVSLLMHQAAIRHPVIISMY